VRSRSGHVLVAIRENQLRATFQGYPVERYKLGVFVISAVVTGFAGSLYGFQNYLVFGGSGLGAVLRRTARDRRDRRHAQHAGACLGALFFMLFRELFSIWTSDWLLWFGLIFVAFVAVLAGWIGRHLGAPEQTLVASAGRIRRHEPPQDL